MNLIISTNTKKQKPNHPDYVVRMKIGDNYEFVGGAWKKQNDKGTYLSLSLGNDNWDFKVTSKKEQGSNESLVEETFSDDFAF